MRPELQITRRFIARFLLIPIFIFLFMGFKCTTILGALLDDDPPEDPLKVLFIGASYFSYNNLPGLFENLVTAAGREVIIGQAIRDGCMLAHHASNTITEQRIRSNEWDVVLLQGVCVNMAFPDSHHLIFPPYRSYPVKPAIETLMAKIQDNCPDTKTMYCMPWAFEDGTLWIPGRTETFFDMQDLVYENTLKFAEELNFQIAPVGWAWKTVLGADPGLHYLHLADWNHPSLRGSYLTACVLYATLYRETVVGNAFKSSLSDSEAENFQQVATSTVLNNLALWRLLP